MESILMIVGNGLSMDLRKWAKPQLENWNPARPLQWDLYTPGNFTVPWLQSLPKFDEIISSLRQEEPEISDFDIFKKSLQFATCNGAPYFVISLLEAEMQHFLAIAYSYFQLEVDKIDFSPWPWAKWLNSYGKNIEGIVSFNYDLVLESALWKSKVSVRRFGVTSESEGIPTLKPHGSIDFGIHSNIFGVSFQGGYPMQNAILRNDFCSLKHLDRSKLLLPRLEADIVLPHEYSPQLNNQWIKPGYDWVQLIGSHFTHCIIVGLSYWHCDRPEIDFLLKSLAAKTRLIVANINPPPELMNMLKAKFSNVIEWRNGPEHII